MSWHLAPGVRMAKVGPDLVFLDIERDAYVCRIDGAPFLHRRSYGLEIEDADLRAELLQAGLVVDRFRAADPAGPVSPPTTDIHTDGGGTPRVRAGDWIAMGAGLLAMARHYHGRSLAQMLARASARGAGPRRRSPSPPTPQLIARARAYDRLLPWAPFQEACLYRSFLLLLFLRDLGADAAWVFGVRTWPFEAHCWVQAGDTVLNDTVDRVRGYTPILVA